MLPRPFLGRERKRGLSRRVSEDVGIHDYEQRHLRPSNADNAPRLRPGEFAGLDDAVDLQGQALTRPRSLDTCRGACRYWSKRLV